MRIALPSLIFWRKNRLPAIFDNDMKQGCGLPYPPWFFGEKTGCLPYLIMIWNKDADCPTLLGFVEEKEIYCFGITKEFFYRGRTRVDTYTVDNEGRKKRQRQLLLKRCIFYDRNHGGGYSLMWKKIIVFWSPSFHWRNWRHGKNYWLTSRRTISVISQGEQKFWKQLYRYCRW